MTFDEWREHRDIHGQWPEPIDGSIVYALWEQHVPNWPRGGDSRSGNAETIGDLDPEIQELLKRARAMRQAQ
jgi:hypothetical protein